jgi:uncharacterized protein YidB (DUF937 family)
MHQLLQHIGPALLEQLAQHVGVGEQA